MARFGAMADDLTLRSPRPEELAAFLEPMYLAFGELPVPGQVEAERAVMDVERFIGAVVGSSWVATAGAYGFRLTVPGGEVAASGITGIGVRPDHRRQGLLRQMMDWLIADATGRGEPVAVLLASEAAIYQRFGFGQASMASSFSFDPMAVAFRDRVDLGPGGRIRLVDAEEAAEVFARIYDQVRPLTPGALDRSESRWRVWLVSDPEWMRRGEGLKFRALLEIDGEPRGYAMYRIQQGWDATGPQETLAVQEVIGLDAQAEQRLWEWLLSMDLVRTVTGRRGPVPHPLQHMLLEPRRMALTVSDGLWLRIIELEAALAGRGYVGSGSLVFDVANEMLPANAGRWQLTVSGGRGSVSRTAAAPDLQLDIDTLAAAYLGGFRFADLAVAGRVRECSAGSLTQADALFTPPRAPWNSTPF
jgi:predicted acetyltransferase